jgi:hypothetical protein
MSLPPLTPSAQFSTFLARFPPEIIALAKRCLAKLRRSFPGAHQLVYDYPSSLLVAFAMSERGYDAIVSVAVLPREVRLYFRRSLPDPKKLLSGSGTKVRSVAVRNAAALNHKDIAALLKSAIRHSGFTAARTRSTTMIIKSGAKQRKPTRSRRAAGRAARTC